MKKYIKKYKSLLVIEAIDESKKYFEYDNTKSDTQNMSYAFSQIEKILKYKSKPPVEQKISYCLGIIRNKFYNSDLQHYGWLIERVVENIEGHLSYTEEEVVQWFDDSLIPFLKNLKDDTLLEEKLENVIQKCVMLNQKN
jgi:hypothetical protein